MGPVKKSKSVNKGFASVPDFSPGKDEKSKQKKRKLSDMLGPQWSKLELERFYEAYRKYGQDWKKVAGSVRSRSKEMVEALYNMNRAYLSLPEGTASVVGLIAMMTDHYNVMGVNRGERDYDEHTVIARKLQKHSKPKVQVGPLKENLQTQSTGPSHRCQSLLKVCYDVIPPCFPVRKRTPRIPVSSLDIHPNKRLRGSAMNMSSDEVSCGAFLLTEAQQTPSSPHVPEATRGDTERAKPSQNSARVKGYREFLVGKPTYRCASVNEESADGSLGSNEVKNGDLVRDSVDSVISASSEFKRGRKKGKKEEVALADAKIFNSTQEAYTFADKGHRGKAGFESASPITHRSTSEFQRKRSKKLMFEDERVACDALQALAEISAMMPCLADNPVEDGGESLGKNALLDATVRDEIKMERKKKCKSEASKVQKAEIHIDHCVMPAENETLPDEEVKPAASSGHLSTVSKSCESSMRSPDVSSSNDRPFEKVEVAVSSLQVHPVSQVVNPTRRKSSRKRDRTLFQIDRHSASSACPSECVSSVQYKVQCLKEKISRCLCWHDVRRWCIYEWFYSAIDYPWFAKREFVEYLDHVGLGHVPRLTRVEWGVIRSSLGKPRRFSRRFLQEEREKLKQYRESVRTHYANLRAGHGEGLPTDLARPLSIGQQVVAIHPKTREIHNGSILTVDHRSCLVQFDSTDLGVELVMDVDCMPLNPVENMPEALRRPKMSFDSQYSQGPSVTGAFTMVLEEHMKNLDSLLYASPFKPSITNEAKVKPASISHATVTGSVSLGIAPATQSQCYNMAHVQPKKDDMRQIPGLRQSLHGKAFEQHNGCPGNPLCWPQPAVKPAGLNGTIHSFNSSAFSFQDTATSVAEIVEGSRDTAQRMVDIAIKAITLMKEGEDAFGRIGEALDAPNKADRATNCKLTTVTPSNTVQGLPHQNPGTHFSSKTLLAGDAPGTISANGSAASDLQVPSNLITSCVATLLMIQTCTDRQFPPAEVAQIIDNAVTSLQPCCSQNLSIYREIQMCMGRIKTQILALVPT